MKVLLTGAAGFIGSCLLWKLNTEGINDVIVVDTINTTDGCANLAGKRFKDYIDKNKLLDYIKAGKLKEDADMVLHIGACSSTTEKDSSYLIRNNYLYSKELAEWALCNKKVFLYASSAATYGDGKLGYSDADKIVPSLKPLNEYGNSKQLFDLWVVQNNLQNEFVGFKFFNVFGPNEYHKGEMRSMVNKGFHQIKKTGKMQLFKSYNPEYKDGEQKRDFIYIKDSLEVVWYFIEHPDKKGIYNVGTGKARSWNELACALFAAMDKEPNIEYIDMPSDVKGHYQYFTEAGLTKLRAAGCDYKFRELDDTVKEYAGYLNAGIYL